MKKIILLILFFIVSPLTLAADNTIKITNNSGEKIVSILIAHESSSPLVSSGPIPPDSVHTFKTIDDDESSETAVVSVNWFNDYWHGVVKFDGDDTHYVLTSSLTALVPYKECRTPSDGSTEIVILSKADVKINTYDASDFSDFDDNCEGSLHPTGDIAGEFASLVAFLISGM